MKVQNKPFCLINLIFCKRGVFNRDVAQALDKICIAGHLYDYGSNCFWFLNEKDRMCHKSLMKYDMVMSYFAENGIVVRSHRRNVKKLQPPMLTVSIYILKKWYTKINNNKHGRRIDEEVNNYKDVKLLPMDTTAKASFSSYMLKTRNVFRTTLRAYRPLAGVPLIRTATLKNRRSHFE